MMRFDLVCENACRKGQPFRAPSAWEGTIDSTRVDEREELTWIILAIIIKARAVEDKGGKGQCNPRSELLLGGRARVKSRARLKWNEEMRKKISRSR